MFVILEKIKIRTEKGTLHYKEWMAMKKFIVDFSTFNDKGLPELSLWGKYLVYATILGCADKLRETMRVKFQNMSSDLTSDYYYYNYYFYDDIGSGISNSVRDAITTSHSTIMAASYSSGSGFGGGSSGGGGCGGGGGGGGHF